MRTSQHPRFFSSRLSPARRRVYGSAAVVFVIIFLASIWPVYTLFSRPEPFVFGIPFSFAYVILLVVGAFICLLSVYLWERRQDDTGG